VTSTDNPYRALELTQLVDDLGRSGLSAPYTRAGLEMLAEALYERGVRSRLHAPYRNSSLIQFTWDPELEGFEITETGIYELVMEAIDVPAIEPFPTFPRAELPRMVHRLRRTAGLRPVLTRMSEVPGHVEPRRRLVSARDGAELQVPDQSLPEGVQRVIQFAEHAGSDPDSLVVLRVADLRATLAEIPDVTPRYPTIWAYEQACRSIRERDERIASALAKLDDWFIGTWAPTPEHVDQVRQALRLRMPRTEPATETEKSEVARAFEACDTDDDANVGDSWSTVARTLRDEALRLAAEVEHLRTLGETLAEDFDSVVVADPDTGEVVPCGTCSALEPPVTKPAVGRTTAGWPRCAQHLVQDELVAAGYSADVKTCPSCHHLASSHFEDGSGCSVTIRDVGLGADSNCPCTFDARSVHRG
jgi:hypothetical protein